MMLRRGFLAFSLLAAHLVLADAAAASGHVYSRRFGNGSDQAVTAVAVDGGGNAIVAGLFAGSIDFGGGSLTSAGGDDAFVAKLGPNGNHLWSRRFGDASAQSATGVAVDAIGNVLVTGYFSGTIDIGGATLTSAGGQDVFVAMFDSNGNHVWSKCFGNSSNQAGAGVAVDPSGNVLLVGTFSGSIDFGGGNLTSAGSTDVFIARLDANGFHSWSKLFGDASAQTGVAVAVDGDGNVFATGAFSGTVDFGGGGLTSAGSTDAFLVKLSAEGNYVWSKRFGDASGQTGLALAVDASGGPILAGSFSGSVNFGGGALASAGSTDGFVAKLDSSGSHLWSRALGGTGTDSANGVAVHGAGDVVVAGGFQASADLGGGTLTSAGGTDLFLARYTAGGSWLTNAQAGDAAEQECRAVAVDASGFAIPAGRFQGGIDLGGGTLLSEGGHDAFAAKLGVGTTLHTLAPCRLVDTRNAAGALGGPALEPGPSRRVFSVAGVCGIPATARSISVNVTVTQPAAAGTLRVFPGDTAEEWTPTSTSISFSAQKTRANNSICLLSKDGAGSLAVRNDAPGTVHFILDVSGYFD